MKQPRKVLTILGTRPEVIKLAPVIMELRRKPEEFVAQLCVTGQHREMLYQTLAQFGLSVDHDLNLMSPGQTLATITGRAVEGVDRVIHKERPDLVLVQGDTTTALCGALAAYYHQVKVGHVEAGLRTGDRYRPFPEEMNRRLVSQLADFHFAPTEGARLALLAEGHADKTIYVTGNTVIDALLWMRNRVRQTPPPIADGLWKAIADKSVILVTGHRRESFGAGLEAICHAIADVAAAQSSVIFVFPVHLNPEVREPVNRILSGQERVLLTEPLPYESFVWLMDRASIVLTDSGGVQEEAPSMGKPVLVTREVTERPEGVAAGNARLVGVQTQQIVSALTELLSDPAVRTSMTRPQNPYGDGHAAQRIVDILEKQL